VPTAAVWRDTLLAILVVSAIPLAAMALLARDERAVRRAGSQLVCFAVGALLGAAFFQLIPEAYEGYEGALGARAVPATVLLGYATFFALEWLLHGLHGHHDARRAARAHGGGDGAGGGPRPRARRRAVVTLNLLGDGLHNLLDGMLIAASFLTHPGVGVLTTVAVSLHEVPRELGSFGVFVHGGVSPRRAVLYNVGTALLSVAGRGRRARRGAARRVARARAAAVRGGQLPLHRGVAARAAGPAGRVAPAAGGARGAGGHGARRHGGAGALPLTHPARAAGGGARARRVPGGTGRTGRRAPARGRRARSPRGGSQTRGMLPRRSSRTVSTTVWFSGAGCVRITTSSSVGRDRLLDHGSRADALGVRAPVHGRVVRGVAHGAPERRVHARRCCHGSGGRRGGTVA
jgi:zinc and cadmium transporter